MHAFVLRLSLMAGVFTATIAGTSADAAPPEVTGVLLERRATDVTASWSPAAGAVAYHVYAGDIGELSAGHYGGCFLGSVDTTPVVLPGQPGPGGASFILVAGFDEIEEGTLGVGSDGGVRDPQPRCTPARFVFHLETNGVAPDGLEDGPAYRGPRRTVDFDQGRPASPVRNRVFVSAVDGDLVVEALDIVVAGRGFDWALARTHHAQITYPGPLGNGWDFSDNMRLRPAVGGLLLHDGTGQTLFFRQQPGISGFTSPPGFFGKLIRNADGTHALRFERGDIHRPHVIGRTYAPGRATYGSARQHVYQHNQSDLAFLRVELDLPPSRYWSTDPYAEDALRSAWNPLIPDPGPTDGPAGGAISGSDANIKGLLWRRPTSPGPVPAGPAFAAINNTKSNIKGLAARFAARSYEWDFDLLPAARLWNNSPYSEDVLRLWNNSPYSEDAPRLWNDSPYSEDAPRIWNNSPYSEDAQRSFTWTQVRGPMAVADFDRDGRLQRVRDESGSTVSYLYDHQKLLTDVVDTLGRTMHYAYDAAGRITSVTDHSGREVAYSYDAAGNLVSVRSPVVVGTSTGNDFPSGKVTTYTYSAGAADTRLNGNITSITPPGAPAVPAVQLDYGPSGTFSADRVIQATFGGVNGSGVGAGGTATYEWDFDNPGANPALPDLVRRRVLVSDTASNRFTIETNAAGQALSLVEETNREVRPGEPDYLTAMRYDPDGSLVWVRSPAGRVTEFTYDTGGADVFRRGNLLAMRTIADPGRGDGHGGPAADRVITFSYEPVGNRIASVTDPRGNDPGYVPPNGGAWSPARYTARVTYAYQEGSFADNGIEALAARWGIDLTGAVCCLGDLDGDGRTDRALHEPARIEWPTVALAPDSRQAAIEGDLLQECVALFTYDAFGQLARMRDPERNVHVFTYHPERDPDGDGVPTPDPPDGRVLAGAGGGLLATARFDAESWPDRNNRTNPAPADVRHDYRYDAPGRLVRLVDGRGVLHRFEWNALGELVQTIDAAATADAGGPHGDGPTGRGEAGLGAPGLRTRLLWDAASDLAQVGVEDPTGSRGVGPFVTTSFTHDLLGNVVRVERQIGGGSAPLVVDLRYAADGSPESITTQDGSVRDTFVHDERGFVHSVTRGASGAYGGAPATGTFDWSGAGRLARRVDGAGGIVDYEYDGLDRLVRVIDEVGSRFTIKDDVVHPGAFEFRWAGPSSGPAPPDRSGAGNVDLAIVLVPRDERDRAMSHDRLLFVPAGLTPIRPAELHEGPLVPADGAVNTEFEYDRADRLTVVLNDDRPVAFIDFDGLDRVLRRTLGATGTNPMYEESRTWDPGGNLVESLERAHSSDGTLASQVRFTTAYYDALGRTTRLVDPDGRTHHFLWNAQADLGAVADPNGPPGGTIRRRSPGFTGVSVAVNAPGNVTRYQYDGLGRPVRSERILTPSGLGDGTFTPAPDTSNPHNPDGIVTRRKTWSPSGFEVTMADDAGNITRRTRSNSRAFVLRVNPDDTRWTASHDGRRLPTSIVDENGTRLEFSYDAARRAVGVFIEPAPGVGGTTLQRFEYDGLSRVTLTHDNNGPGADDDVTTRFLYDSLSRPFEEVQSRPGTPPLAVDYAWLGAGSLTAATWPSGRRMAYEYDAPGRLVRQIDAGGGGGSAGEMTFAYLGSHVVRTTRPGAGESVLLDGAGNAAFDGQWRVKEVRHTGPGGEHLGGYQYRYDGAGRLLSEARTHDTLAPCGSFNGRRYQYDSADRLVAWQDGPLTIDHQPCGPPTYDESFVYDGRGNRVRSTRAGRLFGYTPNNNNQYNELQAGGIAFDDGMPDDFLDDLSTPLADGLNFAYDAARHQTRTGLVRVTYDALGRPVDVSHDGTGGKRAEYSYDAQDRLVRRVAGAGEERILNSRLFGQGIETRRPPLIETEIIPLRIISIPQASMSTSIHQGGARVFHLLGDGHGRRTAVVDSQGPSVVLERVVYDADGKPFFLDANGLPLVDALGRFVAESPSGERYLCEDARYLPEFGARTDDRTTDLGGAHACLGCGVADTNQGRPLSGDGAARTFAASARRGGPGSRIAGPPPVPENP